MELISATRGALTRKGHYSREPWAMAIREKYGDFTGFSRRFSPSLETQAYCRENVERAIERGVESLVRLRKTFGTRKIESLLVGHLSVAVACLGEHGALDNTDIRIIAHEMAACSIGRPICFASVLGFFYELRIGMCKIYGSINPRKVLEAYRDYIERAYQRECRCREEAERRAREREREEHERNCISFEERMRRLGLPYRTMGEWIVSGAAGGGEAPSISSGLSHNKTNAEDGVDPEGMRGNGL